MDQVKVQCIWATDDERAAGVLKSGSACQCKALRHYYNATNRKQNSLEWRRNISITKYNKLWTRENRMHGTGIEWRNVRKKIFVESAAVYPTLKVCIWVNILKKKTYYKVKGINKNKTYQDEELMDISKKQIKRKKKGKEKTKQKTSNTCPVWYS